MAYRKATERQLGYANQSKEMPKVDEVLEKMVEESMEDRQFFNSVGESNTKVIEKLIDAFTKSQEQMATLMKSLTNKSANGPTSG